MTKHSKYYYDFTRNGWKGINVNMEEEEFNGPAYYLGKTHKYEAAKIIEDFQGDNYNLGVAISYLLRCGKKEGNPPAQEIQKAIDHLMFELDRIESDKNG